ncbi:MAG: class I adenylate-forming enzyme family protein [Alphaproteobacteria bacterium]
MSLFSTTVPLSSETVAEYHRTGAWRDRTIYGIVCDHAGRRPEVAALTDSHRTLSWRELVEAVDAFAADLRARGIVQGDSIFVGAPNRMETVIALLAASRDGLVCCPSPHRNHTVAEIADMCVRAGCNAYIHHPGHGSDAAGDEILDLIGGIPSLRHVYRLLPPATGAPFSGCLGTGAPVHEPAGDPDLVTYLAFTSGSTGKPKGVMQSDNTQLVAARGIVAAWGFDENTVTCSLSPFSHNLGCGTLWTSFVCGGEFVVHDWPRTDSTLDRLAAANVDYLVGVPTHAMDLLEELKGRGIETYDRLASFRVSAAACPEHVAGGLYDMGIPVQKGYGMTETNGHQHGLPGDTRAQVTGTSGVCCPDYALAVFDPDDPERILQTGESGLVGGKGGSLMLGYFSDRAATEACLNADGWFLTGDLGRIDADGYLTLTGRRKELIVRGGHNINPNLLEDLALRHPAIDLAAAIPVPDERLGERACLAVMFEKSRSLSAEEVLRHLADEGLSRYDMPEFWLPYNDIPVMPNGKLDKQEIIRRVGDGTLKPEPVS